MNKQKSILIVVLNSSYGGTEKHIVDIANNLNYTHFNLTVVAPLESKLSVTLKEINKPIKIIELKRDISVIFNLKNILKRQNFDIVHMHSPRATFIGMLTIKLFRLNKNTITTAHGWIPDRLTLKKLFEVLFVSTIKDSNKILAVSNNVKESLIKTGIDPKKIKVIYNGIHIPDVNKTSELIKNDESKKIKFIFLGRFIDEKGIKYLIEGLKKLDKKYDQKYILDMYGSGPLFEEVKMEIEKNNLYNVKLKGFLNPDKVHKTLTKYDCFLMPSLQEGFPYTLVEAFAAGLMVIATKVGGIPEALQDQYNGYLIEPKNPVVITNVLEKTLELDLETLSIMRKNALVTSGKYSVYNMVRDIEKEYKAI
ncbi:glycosyltransferase family 4 protein [Fictibacillus sp. 26RED30]|uniref:glycosyltransferase family 4 protein n=1 Tax=Fictibacillus sp. 26RED30 TaxID=2745877 RepID=UPI0018CEC21C|nr:glycosyltransferase family 4 protein [Fictibacillus sp. 26RED30]MBH0161730.1 glycosyltransferase family 4 protein [Fictibacillus sp. 26RED30]